MLKLYLQNEQTMLIDDDNAQKVADKGPPITILTAFFNLMQDNSNMRHKLYLSVYKYFI